MNLVLNLLSATSGGNLTRAEAFIDRFERIAPNVTLIVLKHPSVLCNYQSRKNLIICDISFKLDMFKIFRRFWWENFKLKNFIKKYHPKAYLTFSHSLPIVKIDIPTIVGVSNLAPFSIDAYAAESIFVKIKLLILKKTIVNSCKKGNSVIALSATCKKFLINAGISESKIVVAPNGVDKWWNNHEDAYKNLPNIIDDSSFILYVSHFYRYKNHINLIEGFSKLPNIYNKYKLVLVGRFHDKKYMKDIKNKIDKHKLRERIIILPSQSKDILKSLYFNSSLFIFPSYIENCPNILLEAMMSGSNVISSNILPMPEFAGDAASYFDPHDSDSIANSIKSFFSTLKDPSAINHDSVNQAKNFTWDDFTKIVFNEVSKISL